MLTSIDGQQIEVQENYITSGSVMHDAVYVPGGRNSVDSLMTQGDAIHFINEAFKHCKAIAASNEGVDLLISSDINHVSIAESDNGSMIFSDTGVVTVGNASDLNDFAQEFIKAIAEHRHWARQMHKELVPA
jgi:catalase